MFQLNRTEFELKIRITGLRSRIDPSQIPSPIAVAEEDQETWSEQPYMTCASNLPVPSTSSDYVAIDQGVFRFQCA